MATAARSSTPTAPTTGPATRQQQQENQAVVVNSKTASDGMGSSFVTTYNRTAPSPTGNHVAGFTTKLTSSNYPVFRGFGIVEVVEPTGHKHEHRFFRGLDDGDRRNDVNVQSYDGLTTLLDEEQHKGAEFEVVFKKAAGESGTDPIERRWSEFATKANPSNHRPSGLSSSDKRDWHVYEVYLKKQETHRGSPPPRPSSPTAPTAT